MSVRYSLAATLALLPAAVAAEGGKHFKAPPLEIANLFVYCLFLLVTLFQLVIALRALYRPVTRLPATGAALALTILSLSYALGIVLIVTAFTVDDAGSRHLSDLSYINLQVTATLSFKWSDPAVLGAVASVLLNRYRTVQSPSSVFISFTTTTFVILVIAIVLISSETGMAAAATAAMVRGEISPGNTEAQFLTSTRTFYAYIALYISASLSLAVSASLLRKRIPKDTVVSQILVGVIPPLVLRAIVRFIFTIILVLPFSGAFDNMASALDFSGTLLFGLLYLVAMCYFVSLLNRVSMWDGKRLSKHDAPIALADMGGQEATGKEGEEATDTEKALLGDEAGEMGEDLAESEEAPAGDEAGQEVAGQMEQEAAEPERALVGDEVGQEVVGQMEQEVAEPEKLPLGNEAQQEEEISPQENVPEREGQEGTGKEEASVRNAADQEMAAHDIVASQEVARGVVPVQNEVAQDSPVKDVAVQEVAKGSDSSSAAVEPQEPESQPDTNAAT